MSSEITDSVLDTIKKDFIGVDPSYDVFDGNLILLINSQLSVLNQIGVGTKTPFKITGSSETWSTFFEDKPYLESVKELIGIKVKLAFDPPQNSSLLQAFKDRAFELEWRLNCFEDKGEALFSEESEEDNGL